MNVPADPDRFRAHVAEEQARAALAADELRLTHDDPDAITACGAEVVLSISAVRAIAALLGHSDPDTASPRWLAARLHRARRGGQHEGTGVRATGSAVWLSPKAAGYLIDSLCDAFMRAEGDIL
jgi:hypothetical protein